MPGGARRIGRVFETSRGATGLIPFLTAGYPSIEATLEMMRRFESLGVRAVEIGIPFSDPIADGPEIQRASEWALRSRVSARDVLELIRDYRRGGNLPVVVMTYANPVLRGGIQAFAERAEETGVDGVLITDLPPDESTEVWRALDRAGIDTVMLVAPTTPSDRLPTLLARCRGFVYCLTRTGVTGESAGYAGAIEERIGELRARTELPIAVGFGIARVDQARRLRGVADGVVVGAAFMRAISQEPRVGAVERVEELSRELLQALR